MQCKFEELILFGRVIIEIHRAIPMRDLPFQPPAQPPFLPRESVPCSNFSFPGSRQEIPRSRGYVLANEADE